MGKTVASRSVQSIFQTEYTLQGIVASEALKQVLGASLDSSPCSGTGFCSGCKNVRFLFVRVLGRVRLPLFEKSCCNISSVFESVRVFSVENLWRSLGESLLKSCGKVSTSWRNCEFCTTNGGVFGVFHGFVEKFSYKFSTRIDRGKRVVLHSFHRVYYNYYYYIREFSSGTAKVGERIRKANI